MGLYIQMHSMHGLFRGTNVELGRDEDTGGQIIYVLNLAKAFAKIKGVDKVDIITRRITDPKYPGYSKKIEKVAPKVNIVRIECGPKKYIMKVNLWLYMDEFVDNCKKYIKKAGKPDILHSNYADSGYVCSRLSKELGIPQVHTGHSLGKSKMERLGVNDRNYGKMDRIYNFSKRIVAEQEAIDNSSAIIVSTAEERFYQYSMYDINTNSKKFNVVTPGVNLEKFYPVSRKEDKSARKRLTSAISKCIKDMGKPIVFSISRLDYKKNLISLVKAYAYDKELQEMANLVIVTGRMGKMGKNQQILMDEMIDLIKRKEIKGRVCIIRHINYQIEGGEVYRIARDSKGVFVNPALHEPFGITVIEAGAVGMPVVATNSGGPIETIKRCKHGFVVDPRSTKQIADSIRKILKDNKLWKRFSENGKKNVRQYYSWDATAKKELEIFKRVVKKK